jgi:hypothetical protein
MGDVGAGHIATDQNCIWVVWADLWVEHRTSAPRSDDFEAAGPIVGSHSYKQQRQGNSRERECHYFFPFFD